MNNITAQCFNSDFSNGSYTNWTGSTGENTAGTYTITAGIIPGIDVYVYKIDLREINNGPRHEYIGRVTIDYNKNNDRNEF